MDEHQIEPELLQAPPRRVRRRGTRGFGTVFSRFLAIPIVALAVIMPLWCLHMIAVRTSGPIVTAQIVDRYREANTDKDGWRHYLRYRATISGREVTSRELVDEKSYSQVQVGSTAPLRVSPILPGWDSVLLLPGRNVWGIVVGLGFVSLLMLVGTAVMVWFIFILPARRRNLVINGVPASGRLTDKRKTTSARTQSYFFAYEFSPAPPTASVGSDARDATFITGEQLVRGSEWEEPRIGDTFTVLFDPKNPQFSILYRYADFEVAV